MSSSYEQVQMESREQWRAWLTTWHASRLGVWVVTWKKGRGPYVPYEELVEEALCFGWVDSQSRRLDEDRSQLLHTPRKPRSGWSRPNKERIDRLSAAGLMMPAGLAVVEAAKRSGTWSALDDVENLVEPPELRAALDADPAARTSWDAFPKSAKRAILEWISTARTDATRARRVATTAAEANQGRRANQWRPPGGEPPEAS